MSSNQTFATANDVGPAVNVTTWFLGVAVVLFVIARLTTKIYLPQRLSLDDFIIITATVSTTPKCSNKLTDTGHQLFSIGLIATVTLETRNGLGQHEVTLLPWQITNFQKVTIVLHLRKCSSPSDLPLPDSLRRRFALHPIIVVLKICYPAFDPQDYAGPCPTAAHIRHGHRITAMEYDWFFRGCFPVPCTKSLGYSRGELLRSGLSSFD